MAGHSQSFSTSNQTQTSKQLTQLVRVQQNGKFNHRKVNQKFYNKNGLVVSILISMWQGDSCSDWPVSLGHSYGVTAWSSDLLSGCEWPQSCTTFGIWVENPLSETQNCIFKELKNIFVQKMLKIVKKVTFEAAMTAASSSLSFVFFLMSLMNPARASLLTRPEPWKRSLLPSIPSARKIRTFNSDLKLWGFVLRLVC